MKSSKHRHHPTLQKRKILSGQRTPTRGKRHKNKSPTLGSGPAVEWGEGGLEEDLSESPENIQQLLEIRSRNKEDVE